MPNVSPLPRRLATRPSVRSARLYSRWIIVALITPDQRPHRARQLLLDSLDPDTEPVPDRGSPDDATGTPCAATPAARPDGDDQRLGQLRRHRLTHPVRPAHRRP